MSDRTAASTSLAPASFGALVRHWRHERRLTQFDLASNANVSTRHLSFLETGRAKPSREMVQMLATALGLGTDERSALHRAAGFLPPSADIGLGTEKFQHVRQALDFMLAQQEPYPAIVIDGHWDIRMRNEATRRIFAPFRAGYDIDPGLADNAMHTVFHPGGLRRFISNWEQFAGDMLQLLHRDIAGGSSTAPHLLAEIMSYPGLPTDWMWPKTAADVSPVMTMRLARGDHALAFFSTFTTFAVPADPALQSLKIECFFPADDATAAFARAAVTMTE